MDDPRIHPMLKYNAVATFTQVKNSFQLEGKPMSRSTVKRRFSKGKYRGFTTRCLTLIKAPQSKDGVRNILSMLRHLSLFK